MGLSKGADMTRPCFFQNGLDDQIKNIADSQGRQLALYADSAYAFQRYLITPFEGAVLSKQQSRFNKMMATVRGVVE